MVRNTTIKRIADGIYAEVTRDIEEVARLRKEQVDSFEPKDVDDLLKFTSELTAAVEAMIRGTQVEGVSLPKFLLRIMSVGESTDKVIISVRSKLNSPYKYRKDTEVVRDANFIQNIGQAYLSGLFEMYYIDAASANMNELNDVIAQLLQENEIPIGFKFKVDHTTDADVLEITDDMVVFNASIEKAQNAADIGIVREGDDEFSALIKQEAIEKFITAMKAVQTTAQLVKSRIPVITDLTGLATRKRVSKLIRKSYHRQARYLNIVKKGVGYYDETVKIDGEDVNVFALVGKAEDGTLSVVLKPFDVKTMFNVEFDVLEAVKQQMSEQ